MAITSNVGGVLKQLNPIYANVNGTVKTLNTVHTNVGGTLKQIYSMEKRMTIDISELKSSVAAGYYTGKTSPDESMITPSYRIYHPDIKTPLRVITDFDNINEEFSMMKNYGNGTGPDWVKNYIYNGRISFAQFASSGGSAAGGGGRNRQLYAEMKDGYLCFYFYVYNFNWSSSGSTNMTVLDLTTPLKAILYYK